MSLTEPLEVIVKFALLFFVALAIAAPSFADVTVRFSESAPKDSFIITNEGPCPLGAVDVTLDLGASAAGLIFDVTGAGAGVSVFQPLELVSGQEYLSSIPEVKDGDNVLTLSIVELVSGASIVFTIDVDDTRGSSETMVSGAEIEGAKAMIVGPGLEVQAEFGRDAIARVPLNSCNA